MFLKPGKLEPELLARFLSSNVINDDRVVIRPGIGRDVCAIRMGDTYLVAKTDPVTFTADRIGWYAVHVNANDVATVGARPKWFLATVLLPENRTDEALVQSVWDDLTSALRGIGCALCGGHTEITVGLDRPIVVGQMLGEVAVDGLVDKGSTRPGDRVLLTKGVPVEGTAILARERKDDITREFGGETVREAAGFLDSPGISVLAEALAACEAGAVHAMHDPTEGGVATGLWELARAAACGILIDADRIPLLEPGRSFCRHFGIDPLGTISSGTLLLCVPPEDADGVAEAIRGLDIACTDIGEVRDESEGAVMVRDGRRMEIPVYAQDEIMRALG